MDPTPEINPEAPPANWREAVSDLLSSRVELIQMEAKQASAAGAVKAAALTAMVIAIAFTWALLLAGGIPLIASLSGVQWPLIALATAAAHLLLALVMLARLRRQGSPVFPITRNEFKRDREWFRNLKPPQ